MRICQNPKTCSNFENNILLAKFYQVQARSSRIWRVSFDLVIWIRLPINKMDLKGTQIHLLQQIKLQ